MPPAFPQIAAPTLLAGFCGRFITLAMTYRGDVYSFSVLVPVFRD
ncbi:hypothetical protein SLEP1_g15123 [Rubroshorea leprosula]|uniref:Uncharacterized protein n=1 Tax=Rubroshorea leprosula TaxID=152421 RepID=A0AAV5ISG0_9ROSI|nr:hypothetical protein SLEP1_g15123 [Rubroshorea leprosula]